MESIETILQVMAGIYVGKTIAYYAAFDGWKNMPKYAKTVLALPTPLDAMYGVERNYRKKMAELQQRREETQQRRERLQKEPTDYDK